MLRATGKIAVKTFAIFLLVLRNLQENGEAKRNFFGEKLLLAFTAR